jgi:hypothetical protein
MRENDGLLYRKIRVEHEKLCEANSNPHGTLSVNTACLLCELDMAEQEFPVRFATDGEILVNGKDAYEWFEKWFGTWAKKHPEFFHIVKRDCQYRVKREENEGMHSWIECSKGLDHAEYDCCSNCTEYFQVASNLTHKTEVKE